MSGEWGARVRAGFTNQGLHCRRGGPGGLALQDGWVREHAEAGRLAGPWARLPVRASWPGGRGRGPVPWGGGHWRQERRTP